MTAEHDATPPSPPARQADGAAPPPPVRNRRRTVRRAADQQVRANEQRFRALLAQAHDLVAILAGDGTYRYRYVSPSYERLLGRPLAGWQGRSLVERLHPEDIPRVRAALDALGGHTGAVAWAAYRVRHADGSWRTLASRGANHTDDPAIGGIIVTSQDITERTALAEALRASEQHLRTVVAHTPVILFALDPAGVVTLAEGNGLAALGLAGGEAVGRSALAAHRDAPAVLTDLRRALAGEEVTGIVDRRGVVFEVRYTPLRDAAGRVSGVIGVATDITARQRAEVALARLERAHAALLEAAGEGIVGLDRAGRITFANPAAARLLGYTPDELRDQDLHALAHHTRADGTPYPAAACPMGATLTDGRARHVADEVFWGKEGRRVPVEYRSAAVRAEGEIVGAVVTFQDIGARVQAQHALAHQALHDALTGLPNRTLLLDRLEQALGAARRTGRSVALLLLDLDRFKEVNDALGHPQGDRLLQVVSARLRAALRAVDTVARLGGDEFAVLLPESDEAGAVAVARHLRAALDAPVELQGRAVAVGGSVGIALAPQHGGDVVSLLRRADVAMYAAKEDQQGQAVYDAARDAASAQRLALIADLRQALADGALSLHYQPQVGLTTGRSRGVEALARWPHPRHGLISPALFIPLAEQSGLMAALTRWVLEAALRQARSWGQDGLDVTVAVNLCASDVQDLALPDMVAALLRAAAVPPDRLRLELTEGTLLRDPARGAAVLARLAALGVRSALDDFGTGYSSLAYLARLPVDELKIDQSFVRALEEGEAEAVIVASTIGLGHSLGLAVVAEGVETGATWERLARLGCDAAQGYYVSRPLPAAEMERWLRAGPRDRG